MAGEVKKIVFENTERLSLRQIFECGQCFRWNEAPCEASREAGPECCAESGSDLFEEQQSVERYIGVAGGYACLAEYDGRDLSLTVTGGDAGFWYDYFDLGTSYDEIKTELSCRDDAICAAIENGYGIRILNQDFWEILISFIVSQNNNIPRIKKCIENLCREFGESIGVFEGEERFSFPTPETLALLSTEDLADIRLGYRAPYIIEAAKKYIECGMPVGEPAERRAELLSYLGIGPKVANCIMLFGLRDFRAFPIDVWVKKVMCDMYGFCEKDLKGMQVFAEERFGELGGIAQQYLFFYRRG